MLTKCFLFISLLLLSYGAYTQMYSPINGNDSDTLLKCYCPVTFQLDRDKRHILPDDHPSAKYYNNHKYWYWQNVSEKHPEFGGYWDVKPEYMDSIPDGKGGWIKAPFWNIEQWKRRNRNSYGRNMLCLKCL